MLRENDGTLDDFINRRMEETPEIDWESDDAGGVFGIMFSDGEAFTKEEAEARFLQGVQYYRQSAEKKYREGKGQ